MSSGGTRVIRVRPYVSPQLRANRSAALLNQRVIFLSIRQPNQCDNLIVFKEKKGCQDSKRGTSSAALFLLPTEEQEERKRNPTKSLGTRQDHHFM